MAFYECTFVARQDLGKPDVTKLADEFSAIIAKNGGSVVKSEYWGLRNLAYKINKHRKAHYMLLCLDAPPAAVKELERNFGIHEDVIRHMTVRVDALEEGPSPMMRSGRDDEAPAPELAA